MILLKVKLKAINEYIYIYLRYIRYNITSQSIFRRYDKSIPQYLHDRPKEHIVHCQKHTPKEDQSAAITLLVPGLFSVKGFTTDGVIYEVSFGAEETMHHVNAMTGATQAHASTCSPLSKIIQSGDGTDCNLPTEIHHYLLWILRAWTR